jgi:hypothetical protein
MKRLAPCLLAVLATSTAHAAVVYVPINVLVNTQVGVDIIGDGANDLTLRPPVDCLSGGSATVTGITGASMLADLSVPNFAHVIPFGGLIGPSPDYQGAATLFSCSCCGSAGGWAQRGFEGYMGVRFVVSGQIYFGWVRVRHHTSGALAVLDAAYESGANVSIAAGAGGPTCGSGDFNGDGDSGTDADIEAFFSCIAGQCCVLCGSADFNGDGDTATDADIEAFFRVIAGGNC